MIKVPEMIKHGIWYLTVRFEEFCQHPSQFFEVKNPKMVFKNFGRFCAFCHFNMQYVSHHRSSIFMLVFTKNPFKKLDA